MALGPQQMALGPYINNALGQLQSMALGPVSNALGQLLSYPVKGPMRGGGETTTSPPHPFFKQAPPPPSSSNPPPPSFKEAPPPLFKEAPPPPPWTTAASLKRRYLENVRNELWSGGDSTLWGLQPLQVTGGCCTTELPGITAVPLRNWAEFFAAHLTKDQCPRNGVVHVAHMYRYPWRTAEHVEGDGTSWKTGSQWFQQRSKGGEASQGHCTRRRTARCIRRRVRDSQHRCTACTAVTAAIFAAVAYANSAQFPIHECPTPGSASQVTENTVAPKSKSYWKSGSQNGQAKGCINDHPIRLAEVRAWNVSTNPTETPRMPGFSKSCRSRTHTTKDRAPWTFDSEARRSHYDPKCAASPNATRSNDAGNTGLGFRVTNSMHTAVDVCTGTSCYGSRPRYSSCRAIPEYGFPHGHATDVSSKNTHSATSACCVYRASTCTDASPTHQYRIAE